MNSLLKYLVVEDSETVCRGIRQRMDAFGNWHLCGFAHHVADAVQTAQQHRPQLIFIDWSLQGGSAYEVLQHLQAIPGYQPYIIFNTAYQSENPQIPQEIINNYRVDKYIVKPFWENLRLHLPAYLAEAGQRAMRSEKPQPATVWLKDINGIKLPLNLHELTCILQHESLPRCRNFHFDGKAAPVCIPLTWQQCTELLDEQGIDYFVAKSRAYLLVKSFITSFDRPIVRVKGLALKFEVVKENIPAFEQWLNRFLKGDMKPD